VNGQNRCVRGISFTSFYDVYIGFRNCSDNVMFVIFHFIIKYTTTINQLKVHKRCLLLMNLYIYLYHTFFHAQSNTLSVYHENKWKGKWHLSRMHCVEHICWQLFLQRLQQHVDIFHTTMYNIVFSFSFVFVINR
jgi:hypothetical protein